MKSTRFRLHWTVPCQRYVIYSKWKFFVVFKMYFKITWTWWFERSNILIYCKWPDLPVSSANTSENICSTIKHNFLDMKLFSRKVFVKLIFTKWFFKKIIQWNLFITDIFGDEIVTVLQRCPSYRDKLMSKILQL